MDRRRFLELAAFGIPGAFLSSCLPEPTWRKSWQDAHREKEEQEPASDSAPQQNGVPEAPAAAPVPAAPPVAHPEKSELPVPDYRPPPAPELPSDTPPIKPHHTETGLRPPSSGREEFLREAASIQQDIEQRLEQALTHSAEAAFSDKYASLEIKRIVGRNREGAVSYPASLFTTAHSRASSENIGRLMLDMEQSYLPLDPRDKTVDAAKQSLEAILNAVAASGMKTVDELIHGFPRILARSGFTGTETNGQLLSSMLTRSVAIDLETLGLLYFAAAQHLGIKVHGETQDAQHQNEDILQGTRIPLIWNGLAGRFGPGGFLVRDDTDNYHPLQAMYLSDDQLIARCIIADDAIGQGTYLSPLAKEAILSNVLHRIGKAVEQAYGRSTEALGLLSDALLLDPSNIGIHYSSAGMLLKSGIHHSRALAHLTIALKMDPRFFHGYEARAALYDSHGITDLAEADRQTMKELYRPGNPKFFTPKKE